MNDKKVIPEKPVVFQGTGYRIIRWDRRNLELQVLNGNKNYKGIGYYETIEQALVSIIRRSSLGKVSYDSLEEYVKTITETKETVINDIKRELHQGTASSDDDELFN